MKSMHPLKNYQLETSILAEQQNLNQKDYTSPRQAPVLKTIFINVSYNILVASLTLMALFRAIRVRLATSIWYDTLIKNCFKDWSQSIPLLATCTILTSSYST